MKLAAKLVALIVLGIILWWAVEGYFSVQREVELFDTDMKQDAHLLGDSMKHLIVDVWRSGGQARAMQFIQDMNADEHPMQIRWVWLDAPSGDPSGPRAPREQVEPVRRGQEVHLTIRDEQGHGYLYTYVPVPTGGERPGAVELAESLAVADAYTRATVVRTVVSTGAMLALSVLVVVGLGFWLVGRPLRGLAEKARRVGLGDLTGPVQIRGHDELAELAEHMNVMCARLAEAQARIQAETEARIAALERSRHADRLQTVGRLASGIAHELGTPLNVVSGRAGLLVKGDPSPAEIAESVQVIRNECQRMTTLIRQLLDFARRQSPTKRPTNLNQIVRQTLDLLKPLAVKRNATLCCQDADVPVVASVDGSQIQQVLTNIVMNALQAMPQGGKVEVGVARRRARPPDGSEGSERACSCIQVQDEGEGISEENLRHVFEPFFTTKDVGEGTGLGLSIGYGIVQEHGGWIEVTSKPGRGSCFSVYLPQEVDTCPGES